MNLTKASPNTHAATNRLTDVFEKLEQSQPLAVRLAGNSTAGQTSFSDDPRSTWGFNPLGQFQKPAGIKLCLSHYVARLVTLISECRYLAVLGDAAKDANLSFVKGFSCDKAKEEAAWSSLYDLEKIRTNCFISYSSGLWAPQVEHISPIAAAVEHSEPVVAVNVSDFLDPPSFDWTKSDSRAADAARTFSEDVYADH